MKFCGASKGAVKNFKIVRKKINFFTSLFFNKIVIFQKITDVLKTEHIFLDSRSSSRRFDNLFICLGLIIKL